LNREKECPDIVNFPSISLDNSSEFEPLLKSTDVIEKLSDKAYKTKMKAPAVQQLGTLRGEHPITILEGQPSGR
jgi:hypothetical protein